MNALLRIKFETKNEICNSMLLFQKLNTVMITFGKIYKEKDLEDL